MKYLIQLVWLQLRRSLQARGVGGTLLFLLRNITGLPTQLRRAILEATYDRRLGVQTSGLVRSSDLGIDASKLGEVAVGSISGSAYAPSPAWALPAILKQLDIRHEDYNFVDLGSGMGRVVLMAAEFPFARVVGVEFSPQLHEIAKDNLSHIASRRKARAVEVLLQDAREYTPPQGNCIIYMGNPFRENIMRTVLENLKRWLESERAQVYVVYFIPVLADLLDSSSFLVRLKTDPYYIIYKASMHSGTGAGSTLPVRASV